MDNDKRRWTVTDIEFDDIDSIIALVGAEMPEMEHMRDSNWWVDRLQYRLPASLVLVIRDAPQRPPFGFSWLDKAATVDWRIDEPWWCINSLAVASTRRRGGAGRLIVEAAKSRARECGIVSLYGVCYASSVPFWKAVGFAVSSMGGDLNPDRPVRLVNSEERKEAPLIGGIEDKHMFAVSISEGFPDAARLHLAE